MNLLRASRFDVVLSDWNMPAMSGLELLKAIRADAKLARLPFLMITADANNCTTVSVTLPRHTLNTAQPGA